MTERMEPGRAEAGSVMLHAENVIKTFVTGKSVVTALDRVNLTIRREEFVSLLGPSGCGKSTFLRLVAGLEEKTGGTLLLNGTPITGAGRDRGVVFQQYSLLPWLTAWENVAFALKKSKGLTNAQKKEMAHHFLDLVGLKGFENHYPVQMSGGMQQRVAIARALATDPEILLLDEPFSALDELNREKLNLELLRLWENPRTSLSTVVMVTHSIPESVLMSDRVLVMSPRPAEVTAVVPVPLKRPRETGMEKDPAFYHTVGELRKRVRQP